MKKTAQTDSLDQALTLLGGLSPRQFMRRYWQKKPFLIRQALPGVQSPIDRASLFALAGQDDVESRLVVQKPATGEWTLKHGPIQRRSLPKLSQPAWTLLVQGLDLHVPAAHEMLRQFRFVPDARMDDLMISYASDQGGVGPHYDSYDVFLIQVHGRRRWRIGPVKDGSLRPDVPVKLLSHFEPEEDWVLEPGDMLYLPPMWAHDGIAEGDDCMTCSVGFRVPEATELTQEVLGRCVDAIEPAETRRLYKDPKQDATSTPARIPADLQGFASDAIERFLRDPQQILAALGEVLTEPKPRVWFEPGEPLPVGAGVMLDARTRMMYDDKRIYVNGESWLAAGADARFMRQLADQRQLSAAVVSKASADALELLCQWAEDGWLHPHA